MEKIIKRSGRFPKLYGHSCIFKGFSKHWNKKVFPVYLEVVGSKKLKGLIGGRKLLTG